MTGRNYIATHKPNGIWLCNADLKFSFPLAGHSLSCASVAWSSDGQYLVTADSLYLTQWYKIEQLPEKVIDSSHHVRIWSSNTGEAVATLHHSPTGYFGDLAWVDTDRIVGMDYTAGAVVIWDAISHQEIKRVSDFRVYPSSLAYQIWWGQGKDGILYTLNSETEERTSPFSIETQGITHLFCNPRGTQALILLKNTTAVLCNVSDEFKLFEIEGKINPTWESYDRFDHAFNPWNCDGSLLAGLVGNRLSIWDGQTGKIATEIPYRVDHFAWHPNLPQVLVWTIGNRLVCWDIYLSNALNEMPNPHGVITEMAWSPNGERFCTLTGKGIVQMYHMQPNGAISYQYFPVQQLHLAKYPLGGDVVYTNRETVSAFLVQDWVDNDSSQKPVLISKVEVEKSNEHSSLVFPSIWVFEDMVHLSPDGKFVALGRANTPNPLILVMDVANGRELLRWEDRAAIGLNRLNWRDKHTLMFWIFFATPSSGSRHVIYLWDIEGNEVIPFLELSDIPFTIAINNQGEKICYKDNRNGVDLIVFADRQNNRLDEVPLPNDIDGYDCTDIAWSNDGRYIALVCENLTIYIFDVEIRQVYCQFAGHIGLKTVAVWSPDNRFLATGSEDNVVCIWDIAAQQLVQKLFHASEILSVRWEGNNLLVADRAGMITLWEQLSEEYT